MHILWVKMGGLWPLDTGGHVRSFHTVAELACRHRVTLVTTHGPDDDPKGLAAHLPPGAEVVSIPAVIPRRGTRRFALALVRSWLSRLPVDLWRCRVPALRNEVARRLAGGDVDVCVVDYLAATPNVPRNGEVPQLLFTHNVEHVIWKRVCHVEARAWRRALLQVEWRKMRRSEARACAEAHLTVAVSENDRALLAALAPRAPIHALPTGVDTRYFTPNGSRESPNSLAFHGGMDWFPNEDGVLYFLDTILPRIRREVPDASLTVVGRNPSERLRRAAEKATVHVTGPVDDVRPYLAGAAACVVPLRVGGGTRLKIFEALAMGKPVVSTSIGAEGLPIVPGTHFLQADGPADFAAAVVGLLRDPARRKALGSAGRRLVEERYSWTQVAREFEARCEEVVRRHAR